MADDDIVVCGIGGRFPGADNVDEFWKLLVNGENHLRDIPKERFDMDPYYHSDPNQPMKSYVKKAGLIDDAFSWDYRLYGISEREAQTIDPQQRMVLDCVYMAMEDAGITTKHLDRSNTAVFIGAMNDDFKGTYNTKAKTIDGMSATGIFPTLISARVSYVFNLLGTAATIDTACSSSLVAIHMACQSLKLGECDAAIAGGVNFIFDPTAFVILSKARMLSPTGQCHTFSKDADGYARGEGCGIVILKTLKKALEDGNPIWGILKTGTNQDGRTVSPVNAPSKEQQIKLLETIYSRNNINKEHIQVIEAHGTGTPVGDPTETDALGQFFTDGGRTTRDNPILVGSVKANIGHLESAAGVTGLIKVLLMMKHKLVVPLPMYTRETQNPKLNIQHYHMEVPVEPTEWQSGVAGSRTACVNSFGFGGTNAHAIVQEYIALPANHNYEHATDSKDDNYIIAISANDQTSLLENIKTFQKSINQHKYTLHDISYTSLCKRSHHYRRKAFVVQNETDLQRECIDFMSNQLKPNQASAKEKQLVFFFTGVGTSWRGMGKQLLEYPVFKNTVTEIDTYLQPLLGWSLVDAWVTDKDIKEPLLNHLSIFSYQVGLLSIWNRWGIVPDKVIGQSVGEVAAAYCAGAFDLKCAVNIIFQRSKALQVCKEGGMMVIRNIPTKTIQSLCFSTYTQLVISGYISPSSCVVSGDRKELLQLKKVVKRDPVCVVNDLDTQCAYHSPYVEKAAEQLKTSLENSIESKPLQIQMISTVTGISCGQWDLGTSLYWSDNVRKPVEQFKAIKALKDKQKRSIFLEVGPCPVLGAHKQDIFDKQEEAVIIPSVLKGKEMKQMKVALADLFMQGYDPDWEKVIAHGQSLKTVPRYAFTKYFTMFQLESKQSTNGLNSHMYVSTTTTTSGALTHTITINKETSYFVYGHLVQGQIVVPGATYADVGYELGKSIIGLSVHEIGVSLDFITAAKLNKDEEIEMVVNITRKDTKCVSFSIKHGHLLICTGTAFKMKQRIEQWPQYHGLSDNDQSVTYQRKDVYKALGRMGFEYGDSLKLIQCVYIDTEGDACTGEFKVHSSLKDELNRAVFHACILDATLQLAGLLISLVEQREESKGRFLVFPIGFSCIHVSGQFSNTLTVRAIRVNRTVLSTVLKEHYNIFVYNDEGLLAACVQNAAFFCRMTDDKSPDELTYRIVLEPLQLPMLPQEKQKVNILTINGSNIFKNFPEDGRIRMIHANLLDKPEISVNKTRESIYRSLQTSRLSLEVIDAILYICESSPDEEVVTIDLFEKIKTQCLKIGNFIEVLDQLPDRPPIFIITERVYDKYKVSLLGAEIYGYLRSVMQEYMFLDITLVDVSPSVSERYQSLLNFVDTNISTDEVIPVEVVISDNNVSSMVMTKSKQKEILPLMCINRCTRDEHVYIEPVGSSILKSSVSIFEPNGKEWYFGNEDAYVDIDVSYMCVHNTNIYPLTMPNARTERATIALEYVGYVNKTIGDISTKGNCRRTVNTDNNFENTDQLDNKWETAVFYPTELSHKVRVPLHCTIDLRRHTWYRPGILTAAFVAYALAKAVPRTNILGVVCSSKHDISVHVVQRLLRKRCTKIKIVEASELYQKSKQQYLPAIVTVIGKLQDSAYKAFKSCKEIVCLSSCLSSKLKEQLQIGDKVVVTTVDSVVIFNAKTVREKMHKVLKVLNKVYKKNISANDVSIDIGNKIGPSKHVQPILSVPCNTFPMRSKNGNTCDHKMMVPRKSMFRKDCLYIVTGGLTGLGWELVQLIAEMGATNIITFGRRSCSSEIAANLKEIGTKFSCIITHIAVNVADEKSVHNAFVTIQKMFPSLPIRGVFHGAGVVKSHLIKDRSEKMLVENLLPKVSGTIILHNATKHCPLDYFVLHSSINSIIGSHGQSAYGAANSFMNAFAQWRRQRGLPAISICWGALAVGMAANSKVRRELEKQGHYLMSVASLRDCFIHALLHDENMPVYALLDNNIIARDYSQESMISLQHKLGFIREEGLFQNDESKTKDICLDVREYQQLNREQKWKYLTDIVVILAQSVFGCTPEDCLPSATYIQLGLDSMTAQIFTSVLFEKTNYRLGVEMLYIDRHSLNDTVRFLYEFMKYQEDFREEELAFDEEVFTGLTKGTAELTKGPNEADVVPLDETQKSSRHRGSRRSSSVYDRTESNGLVTLNRVPPVTSTVDRGVSKQGRPRVLPRTNSYTLISVSRSISIGSDGQQEDVVTKL